MSGKQLTPSQRPLQAVILAGGRGTRLKHLTEERPKPMVEVAGKPFLEYQLRQIREQGFSKVLLLLGYRAEVVQNYFGDGERFGLQIEYSVTAAEDETARRIKLAESYLDPFFLLMYCDNYWPMQIDKMWERYIAGSAPVMITVYTNKDGYTRNSVLVDDEGFVAVYDKTSTGTGLQGVEISYALVDRSVLELMPGGNISIEDALYARLAAQHELMAYVTDHRYYSVGALHRLPLTEAFFTGKPTIILDRDGVINRKAPRAEYVRSWQEFAWLPGTKDALRLLHESGFRVVIVSNQAGIGRGLMTEADLGEIHRHMIEETEQAGGKIDAIYFCPHDWDSGCECRKPKPGMLFQAQKELHLDLTRTWFVGDDDRDRQAAEAAGCRFAMVSEDRSLLAVTREMIASGEWQPVA